MPRANQPSDTTLITLSQISELAGVRPSAVSNWRRRFEDFPAPASSIGAGKDLFAFPEVERWLEAHGRRNPGKRNERLLFEAADLLRSDAASGQLVEVLCAAVSLAYLLSTRTGAPSAGVREDNARALVESVEASDPSLRNVFTPLLELAPERAVHLLNLVGALDPDGLRDLYEWALARRSRFVETRTSEDVADLLIGLGGDSPATIFDPAAGEGGFMLAAGRAAREARLCGQELSSSAWRIARQRFLVHEVTATIAIGDSLADDAFPDLRADIVYCDPPYGAVARWREGAIADRRWLFGFPSGKTTDYAWLQHAIYHLTETGRGYVLLPAGSLFRRGREADLRRELVRRGAVEAIISLPAGTAEHTAVPIAIWIVRRPDSTTEPPPVLFVDGATDASTKRGGLDGRVATEIIDTINGWRRNGRIEQRDHRIALAVPVLEILGTDANLLPSRWAHEAQPLDAGRRRADLAEGVIRFQEARDALTGIDLNIEEMSVPAAHSPTWIRISELTTDSLVEVIRGVRVRPEDCLPAGVRAVRTRDVREGITDGEDACYVKPNSMSPQPEVTRPGDIIVSPGSGSPIAVVDRTGGNILVYPVQGLRIRGDWIDPGVAAAFVESPRNRRFVAGTAYGYARLDLRDIELPMVPHEEATPLQEALECVAESERLAKQLGESARTVREALLDLASFGGDNGAPTGTDRA